MAPGQIRGHKVSLKFLETRWHLELLYLSAVQVSANLPSLVTDLGQHDLMAHRILQCDPRQWLIRDFFDTGMDTTVWTIRRHQREIAPEDDVAIWLSGQGSGIAALGTVTGPARFGSVSAGDEGWWTVTHEREQHRWTVPRSELIAAERFRHSLIIRAPFGANPSRSTRRHRRRSSVGPDRRQARAALSRNGTVSEPDPAAGLAANFSSTPRSAPPLLDQLIAGTVTGRSSAHSLRLDSEAVSNPGILQQLNTKCEGVAGVEGDQGRRPTAAPGTGSAAAHPLAVPAAEPHPFRFPGGNRGRFSFVGGRCA